VISETSHYYNRLRHVSETRGKVELLDGVQVGALGWSSALDLVPSLVLESVEGGHTQHDAETEAGERNVDRATLLELRLLLGGEEEGGGERHALTEGVEHTEVGGTLRLVSSVSGHPGDDERDVRVTGGDDANAAEVPGVELGSGRLVRVHSEQDGPTDDTDDEDGSSGEGTSLVSVREGRHEQHEDEGDGVRRDSEELGLNMSDGLRFDHIRLT